MESTQEVEQVRALLSETLATVDGLQSISVFTDEGIELLAAHSTAHGDAAVEPVLNRDRAAVFAGSADQVAQLSQGNMKVVTAHYSNHISILAAHRPLIVSLIARPDLDSTGIQRVRALVEPLETLLKPLRDSVASCDGSDEA